MGYSIQVGGRTSGLINAIYFDPRQVSPWRGSRNNWEDEGIAGSYTLNEKMFIIVGILKVRKVFLKINYENYYNNDK
ncbi:hypothetical protein PZ892_16470 [Sphingobacterium sp. WM]|uniref:hypothetical protein n=1 Tax=Sphingobacterium sp. WM TaxID=3031802 RepID=UPI00240CFBCA|nr:hypothetical protein [Sphingobacterium sp. WM]WFB63254.1 hypothetical protein PZ892_16470 [Sphingobacterium sp. WM]